MRKFIRQINLILSIFMIFCFISSCKSNKGETGNKIQVDNIYKGSGKFDKDTLYISASNFNSSNNNAIVKQDILNVGIKYLNKFNFNPYLIESNYDYQVIDAIWEPLMKTGLDGEFFPNILKQLPTVSEDRKTYFFSLREDLVWEDGTKLTTKDVDFTYKFLMDSNYRGSFDRETLDIKNWREYNSGSVDFIEGIEIIDEYNFRVTVENPSVQTIGLLNIYPLSYLYYGQYYYQGRANEIFERNLRPFGNGVFKFLGYEDENYLILKANENYYKGKTDIETLTFKKVDEENYIRNLISGDIDIAYDVLFNNENIEKTANAQFLNGYIFDSYGYVSIGINHSNESLKEIPVRKAINLAIDKNKIAESVSNLKLNVIDSPIDRIFYKFFYDKDNVKNTFNKIEAVRVLNEQGWIKNRYDIFEKDGKALQFKILVQKNDKLCQNIYPKIELDLKNAGISLIKEEFDIYNISDFISKKNDYDLFLVSDGFISGSSWYRSFHTSGMDNHIFYSNQRLDEILTHINRNFDIESNKDFYIEAYEILKEDLPVIPLFQCKKFDVYNRRIFGINSVNIFKTFYYDEIILRK
ncbi:ABC transporter substrate-binding protein [Candidatus Arthromitus sp. SFB-rat-Yit]|uniref:ABC transporter substrate-binding protein n=1 Tax=Candidatus Arthromitus sp. SFB-rat-Yit TaxID=1041504 RepID=UPI000227A291|nr:ABC transporter substrate-binding protein [Candidatus Arthromitus sp. SFB-rat-Yit]BAK81433.1 putative oligopeptide transporter, periplasmic-binding protein [Candidatus Arthromitus sp. SFB-rat-Yit]